MSLAERVRKIFFGPLGLAAALTAAVHATYPPVAAHQLSAWFREENLEKRVVPASAYVDLPLQEWWNAREYLTYAHSLTWQYGSLSGQEDCLYFVDSTFDAYRQIVALHSREDLQNKVRIAATPRAGKSDAGHVWLEIFEEGKWVPFETLDPTDLLLPGEVPAYVLRNKEQKAKLEITVEESQKPDFLTVPGTEHFKAQGRAYLYPGGILHVAYREYKERKGL